MSRLILQTAVAVVCLACASLANAQDKYANVPESAQRYEKVEKAVNDILSKQKDLDDKQRAVYRQILMDAIERYLADPTVGGFYPKSEYQRLVDEKRALESVKAKLQKSVDDYSKVDQVSALTQEKDRALMEKKAEYDALLQAKQAQIDGINAECQRIEAQLNAQTAMESSLQTKVNDVSDIIQQGNDIKQAVLDLYQQTSKAPNLNLVGPAKIKAAIKNYEDYIQLQKKPKNELAKEISYLNAAIAGAEFRDKAKAFLKQAYDKQKHQELEREYRSLSQTFAKLNANQRNELQGCLQDVEASQNPAQRLADMVNVFFTEQGMVPAPLIDDFKGELETKIKALTGKDSAPWYPAKYENLNNSFDWLLKNLKGMDENEMEAYLNQFYKKLGCCPTQK